MTTIEMLVKANHQLARLALSDIAEESGETQAAMELRGDIELLACFPLVIDCGDWQATEEGDGNGRSLFGQRNGDGISSYGWFNGNGIGSGKMLNHDDRGDGGGAGYDCGQCSSPLGDQYGTLSYTTDESQYY